MIPAVRAEYNRQFSQAAFEELLSDIRRQYPGQLDFPVAETPVFVPETLKNKLITACESIIDDLTAPDFRQKTEAAIPAHQRVPNENDHSHFLAIDFAITRDSEGQLSPQLIELQGFPSIFCFQTLLTETFRQHMPIPENLQAYFGKTPHDYIAALRELIVAGERPEHCILLEIFPEKQKTRIDFAVTEHLLGVRAVCLTKIIKQGRNLFYDRDGVRTPIRRIYNRLIFDDLAQFPDLKTDFQLTDDVDVAWVGHPNWYFRISKYTLPLLSGPAIPESRYVSDYQGNFPENLADYVLKPLYSFAGSGVDLHPTPETLAALEDPQQYILQRKVSYEPVVQGLDGLIKCEIRMLYGWPDAAARPQLLTSLGRLSRGEMIGVRFNAGKTWVGGTAAFYA